VSLFKGHNQIVVPIVPIEWCIRDASEAYHKGSPWLEVIHITAADPVVGPSTASPNRYVHGVVPNPDYDKDWKPRTAAQDEAANYIVRGAIGTPPVFDEVTECHTEH